jgi:hypothetical protein
VGQGSVVVSLLDSDDETDGLVNVLFSQREDPSKVFETVPMKIYLSRIIFDPWINDHLRQEQNNIEYLKARLSNDACRQSRKSKEVGRKMPKDSGENRKESRKREIIRIGEEGGWT